MYIYICIYHLLWSLFLAIYPTKLAAPLRHLAGDIFARESTVRWLKRCSRQCTLYIYVIEDTKYIREKIERKSENETKLYTMNEEGMNVLFSILEIQLSFIRTPGQRA